MEKKEKGGKGKNNKCDIVINYEKQGHYRKWKCCEEVECTKINILIPTNTPVNK